MPETEETKGKKERLTNKFARIKVLGDRARQLEMGAQPMVETPGKSFLDTAILELEQDKIQIFYQVKPEPSNPPTADKEESAE